MKRSIEALGQAEGAATAAPALRDEPREERRPKRKVAVLIGYCGTGYHGMQLNPPHKTIESELFNAFVKAGAISKDNSDDPKKSSLIRAARTDKGVHAVGNVVSLKLIIEDADIVDRINAALPEQIRVWGINRVNKSFECRKSCSSRIYEYILPTYTLMSPNPLSALGKRLGDVVDSKLTPTLLEENNKFWSELKEKLSAAGFTPADLEKETETETNVNENEKPEETPRSKEVKQLENSHRRSYRALPERIEALRTVLNQYQGVHNFHNFTVGKAFNDPSATRVMKSFTVSEPELINGTEWVSIKIHGQSFMLHQIRKMIAAAVLLVRTGAPESRITQLYNSAKVGIPKAPALGLMLERPCYDAYNERLARLGHEAITFDPHSDKMNEFKHKFIYDKIYAKEEDENEFHAFFGFVDTYRVSQLLDYIVDGKITERKEAEAREETLKESQEEAGIEE